MSTITTIVHFSMPKENTDEFLTSWRKTQDIMLKQPGAMDGVMHRAIDDSSPFQFVNVAQWESSEALANALRVAGGQRKEDEGVDVVAEMQRLGARISQSNYVVAMKY